MKTLIQRSFLKDIQSIDTDWPSELVGSHSERQFGHRELRLLYQGQGDYRGQLDAFKGEMGAFKSAERERLRLIKVTNLRTLWDKLIETIDYFIKVLLPNFVSSFGLVTSLPIMLYFIFT